MRRLMGAGVLLLAAFVLASLLPPPPSGRAPETDAPAAVFDLETGAALPGGSAKPAPRVPAQAAAETRPAPRTLKVDETLGTPPRSWYVQVGSFENQANARGVTSRLGGRGLPAAIQSVAVGQTVWYRVRVGPYTGEDAARRALEEIRGQGYQTATLVRPQTAPATRRN